MGNVVIGIHGLANKPRRDLKGEWWKAAIAEGLVVNEKLAKPDFAFEMVYWADYLYRSPNHDDADYSFDDLYNWEPYKPATRMPKRYETGALDALRGWAGNVTDALLDKLQTSSKIGSIENVLLGKLVRDLAFYYDANRMVAERPKAPGDTRVRRGAREVLKDELKAAIRKHAGSRLMVVAHSMGTIIAYEALRDLGREPQPIEVARFVTIGSPLGLPLVKARTQAERQRKASGEIDKSPVRTPTVVTEGWVNFADRRDPVAADSHLRDDYAPNDRGVQVEDDLVWNDFEAPDPQDAMRPKDNPHKSYGYLRTPEFSEYVRKFLGL